MNSKNVLKRILGENPKKESWLFEDTDNDGVVNFKDCNPTNPNEQGWIHKFGNFLRGRGYQDTLHQVKKGIERGEINARVLSEEEQHQRFEQRNIEQDKKDTVSDIQTFKDMESMSKPKQFVEKAKIVGREFKQSVQRGGEAMVNYPNVSPVYSYAETDFYKKLDTASKDDTLGEIGLPGYKVKVSDVATTVKNTLDFAEGVTRSLPFVPRTTYEWENIKEKPFLVAGQAVGDLAQIEGATNVLKTNAPFVKPYIDSAKTSKYVAPVLNKIAPVTSKLKDINTFMTSNPLKETLYLIPKQLAKTEIIKGVGEKWEEKTRPEYSFDYGKLEEVYPEALLQSSVKGNENNSKLVNAGLGLVDDVSLLTGSEKEFKEILKTKADEFNLSPKQTQEFIEAGVRKRTYSGRGEFLSNLGTEILSEMTGRNIITKQILKKPLKGPNLAWQGFILGAKNLAGIGVIEGVSSEYTKQRMREQPINYKDMIWGGVGGGLSAGGIGGGLIGLDIKKATAKNAGDAILTQITRDWTSTTANILDPFELPGDKSVDLISSLKFKTLGGVEQNVFINPKVPSLSVSTKTHVGTTPISMAKQHGTAFVGSMKTKGKTTLNTLFGARGDTAISLQAKLDSMVGPPTKSQSRTDTTASTDTNTDTSTNTNTDTSTDTDTTSSSSASTNTSVLLTTSTPTKFAIPIGFIPGGSGGGYGFGSRISSKLVSVKVKNLAKQSKLKRQLNMNKYKSQTGFKKEMSNFGGSFKPNSFKPTSNILKYGAFDSSFKKMISKKPLKTKSTTYKPKKGFMNEMSKFGKTFKSIEKPKKFNVGKFV